jgi:hypothetical protein
VDRHLSQSDPAAIDDGGDDGGGEDANGDVGDDDSGDSGDAGVGDPDHGDGEDGASEDANGDVGDAGAGNPDPGDPDPDHGEDGDVELIPTESGIKPEDRSECIRAALSVMDAFQYGTGEYSAREFGAALVVLARSRNRSEGIAAAVELTNKLDEVAAILIGIEERREAQRKIQQRAERAALAERRKTAKGAVTRRITVDDAVSGAWAVLEELAGEMREAFDNTPENLQQSAVGQAREEAADALENLSQPSVPDGLGDREFEYTYLPLKARASRSERCCDAVAMLQAVVDELEDDDGEAATGLRDELDELISEAEAVEFPGMYG